MFDKSAIKPSSEPIPESGWYLCWIGGGKPEVLWGVAGNTEWRSGAMRRPVDYYAGPVPERKGR